MPWYLLVLLRNRKHPKAAASTTPTRTPIVMPAMVHGELPVLVFSAEKGKERGEGENPSSFKEIMRGVAGGSASLGRRNCHQVSVWFVGVVITLFAQSRPCQ